MIKVEVIQEMHAVAAWESQDEQRVAGKVMCD